MELRDSVGNLLPDYMHIDRNSTVSERVNSVDMTIFLLSVGIALDTGAHVVYDKESRTASITKNDAIDIVSHP